MGVDLIHIQRYRSFFVCERDNKLIHLNEIYFEFKYDLLRDIVESKAIYFWEMLV